MLATAATRIHGASATAATLIAIPETTKKTGMNTL